MTNENSEASAWPHGRRQADCQSHRRPMTRLGCIRTVITSKLCRGSTPTSGEDHLALKLRAAFKSP